MKLSAKLISLFLLTGVIPMAIKADHSLARKAHKLLKRKRELDKSDHVFYDVTDGPTHRAETKVAARATAEKMIPLEDDCDDLKDFNS
jgi:hypothetical protein